MFLMREVLYCKPGKVGELAKKFQALGEVLKDMGYQPFRLYTDVAGEKFWTLVLESESESVDAFFEMEATAMGDERAQAAMDGYHELVEQGRREIYRVKA